VFGRSYEVVREGARVRSGPGTKHEIVGKKAEGDRVRVVETSGEWLRLEEGGWIFAPLVRPLGGRPAEAPPAETPAPPAAAPRPRSMQVRVVKESATLREGPGDSQTVVGKASRGEVLEVVEFRDGWLRTKDGAWVHHEQVLPLTAAGQPVTEREYRQWGLLSLTGVYIKLVEVPPESIVAQRVNESLNRLTGKKRNYSFFTIVVDVPPAASFRFNFSPGHNRVLIVDTAGREFGNFVHTQGVLEELPPEVRVLFEAQEVFPGNVGTGILAFSGELRADQVDRVFVYVSGRMQELYEEG
jgi:hypothetical protein